MKNVLAFVLALIWAVPGFAADDNVDMPASQTLLNSVSGHWLTESKTGKVRIEDCGDGTPCGIMTHVTPPPGKEAIDGNNPDPALRDRSLVGITMLWEFRAKKGQWVSGKIYDPESGKTYKSKIKGLEDGRLQVKGCVGPICKKQIWTLITP